MKTLTINEAQLISGGCPTCPVVPGACVAAGLVVATASYCGWGATIGYIAGTTMIAGGAYLLYQKIEEKGLSNIFS